MAAANNRPARLNRVLLFIVGLILLASSAFALLVGFAVLPLIRKTATLTPGTVHLPSWAAVVTLVAAVVVGLLCLRWLWAQTRPQPRAARWGLESDPAGGDTRIDSSTAVAPLLDEVGDYPGVNRVSGRLYGSTKRPHLNLVVGTVDSADVSELRRRIDTEAIPRLRRALEMPGLSADLLLRLDDARSPRLA